MDEEQAYSQYYLGLIEDAKQAREAIKHSSNGFMEALESFDRLILALGIFDRVVQVKQPLDYPELDFGTDANGSPV